MKPEKVSCIEHHLVFQEDLNKAQIAGETHPNFSDSDEEEEDDLEKNPEGQLDVQEVP